MDSVQDAVHVGRDAQLTRHRQPIGGEGVFQLHDVEVSLFQPGPRELCAQATSRLPLQDEAIRRWVEHMRPRVSHRQPLR